MVFGFKPFSSSGVPAYADKNLHWNTVDARGADGLLHHGRVIDCTEEGLMIDFRAGNSTLVPFGQIYRSKLEPFKEPSTPNTDSVAVDALLRLQREEPAKWYPGTLLIGEFCLFGSYALVRITTPDGSALEVIPGECLREQRSEEGLEKFLLEKGQFVKEEVQLPSGVASGSPSPGPYQTPSADRCLLERFNANCSGQWMVATHIDGGVLHVLKITDRFRRKFDRDYRSSCPKLEGDALYRMLGVTPQMQRKRTNDALTVEAEKNAKRAFFGGEPFGLFGGVNPAPRSTPVDPLSVPLFGNNGLKPLATVFTASSRVASGPVSQSNGSFANFSLFGSPLPGFGQSCLFSDALFKLPPMNQALPGEILTEIFDCLDGVPQTKLRRVCSLWNGILTTVPGNRMFRVSDNNRALGSASIMPRMCLLKRWTAQTKIIAYTTTVNTGSIFDNGSSAARNGFSAARDHFADKQHYASLMCSGRLFRCIFKENQLPRLDTLMLVDVAWQWRWHFMERRGHFTRFVNQMRDELNTFTSVCHTLVLRDVCIVLSGDKTPVVVRVAKGRITDELSTDTLWSLMDKSLAPLTDADVACWTEWMNDNSDDELPDQLAEILNERQSADPRDSNELRGKEWTCGDLGNLELDKLNRITAHSLVKTCCYEKLVLVLNF